MAVAFQLVRVWDSEIAVWNVEHGHIFSFQICTGENQLLRGIVRDAPDATEPAARFYDEALAFATEQARSRKLIN